MIEALTNLAGASFINTIGILVALVALETVLSADNAIALAALVQPLENSVQQRQALNWGVVIAFILRIGLLFAATWMIQFWQFELVGALYLLWLGVKYFWSRLFAGEDGAEGDRDSQRTCSLWQIVSLIAVTDLAFSLDSVTTAIALSSKTWMVLTGCLIGIITLRFLAEFFMQCLEQFTYLQDAAYLTVLGVGLRLLGRALHLGYVPPNWIVLTTIAVLFAWGFSKRTIPDVERVAVSGLVDHHPE